MAVDGRGSIPQRMLYNLLKEIYPHYQIVYEYPLGDLEQRIDLFIPDLGIAVEYNGEQHYKFISHFHKDETDWNKSVLLDKQKINYLEEKGVKLVIIPFNTKIKTAAELKEVIDNTEYPDYEYSGLETKTNAQKLREANAKSYQQSLKESYRNSTEYQKHKENVKKLRKEKYKELKEQFKNRK